MDIALFNPIVALVHDATVNRWHPILYAESPLPGPPSSGKPVRHKSKCHHTQGFATREEGLAGAKVLADQVVEHGLAPSVKMAVTEDLEWDGQDVPADVAFFTDLPDGTAKRLL